MDEPADRHLVGLSRDHDFEAAALVDRPANTSSPGPLGTGIDSPVSEARSTVPSPDVTTPSSGMLSPERTTNKSPTATSSIGTVTFSPSQRICASSGRILARDLIARRERPMA
jgi:hypothetical protein